MPNFSYLLWTSVVARKSSRPSHRTVCFADLLKEGKGVWLTSASITHSAGWLWCGGTGLKTTKSNTIGLGDRLAGQVCLAQRCPWSYSVVNGQGGGLGILRLREHLVKSNTTAMLTPASWYSRLWSRSSVTKLCSDGSCLPNSCRWFKWAV